MRIQNIEFVLNPKQKIFCETENVDEVCYGGAAGGGKTFVQCVDALRYAIKYPGSKQLMIRRTFPELERNIVRQTLAIFPQKPFAKYNATKHLWTFANGSIIELGYLARENDVFNFQGSEWDAIRIDECTHLPYSSVDYLRSRLRGAKPFPRSMRYSTNPGNIGHLWVKSRFVDPVPPFHVFKGGDGTNRLYIPASVYDNKELMRNDPGYVMRLEAIQDEVTREMLLNGNWNIAAGAFFKEFSYQTHVVEPFDFTKNEGLKLYRSIDYGLDMLACYWYAELPPSAVNPEGSVFIYRELCAEDLPISDAVKLIKDATPPNEHIIATYAPVDVMRHRDRVKGRNQADMFQQSGMTDLVESNNDRKAGWLAVKELLKKRGDYSRPILKIFSTCKNLIKYLPMQIHDEKNYGDVVTEPHEISHSVDSLRYYAIQWHTHHTWVSAEERGARVYYPPDMLADYRRSKPADRLEIERMMGGKPKYN
jgi:hypothetical protein